MSCLQGKGIFLIRDVEKVPVDFSSTFVAQRPATYLSYLLYLYLLFASICLHLEVYQQAFAARWLQVRSALVRLGERLRSPTHLPA